MSLLRLKYFIILTEFKNYTRAAEALFLSQSALSRQIMTLEQELGAKLFERNKNKVELTEIGKVCYKEAKLILATWEQLEKNIEQQTEGSVGELKIGYYGYLEGDYLAKVLSHMHQLYPHIEITFLRKPISELARELLRNNLDVIITVEGEIDQYREFDSIRLSKESLSVIVGENHWMYNEKTIKTEDLKNENLLIVDPMIAPRFHNNIIRYLNKCNYQMKKVTYDDDFWNLMYRLLAGKEISICSTVTDSMLKYNLKSIPLENFQESFCDLVVAYNNTNPNKALAPFLKVIKNIIETEKFASEE